MTTSEDLEKMYKELNTQATDTMMAFHQHKLYHVYSGERFGSQTKVVANGCNASCGHTDQKHLLFVNSANKFHFLYSTYNSCYFVYFFLSFHFTNAILEKFRSTSFNFLGNNFFKVYYIFFSVLFKIINFE